MERTANGEGPERRAGNQAVAEILEAGWLDAGPYRRATAIWLRRDCAWERAHTAVMRS